MKRLPNDPDYLPTQEIPKMEWAISFSAALVPLGPKYNIAPELISSVTANADIIAAFLANFKKAKQFYSELVLNKQSLLLVNPPTPNPLVDLAPLPTFTAWPSASVSSTLLNPHIEAAELLIANIKLTAADRTTLGLDKQPSTTSKRISADNFNYPMLSYSMENNIVRLTIKRGNRWKGYVCQVAMATGDAGVFKQLTLTVNKTVEVPVVAPTDKLATTLIFQAVYMDGNNVVSDWSPSLVVAIGKPNEPELVMAA